jgi:hypothetical protein
MRFRLLIAVVVVVVAAVGFVLARYLTTENRERDQVVELLVAQARGDADEMLDVLSPACARDAGCREAVAENARKLRREGDPKIIAYESSTAYALGAATGKTRVAWTVVDGSLPVVQCVMVRREGTALTGRTVTLLAISTPIGNEASC